MLKLPPWLQAALVGAITFTWVVSILATIVLEGYKVPPELNALFTALVGAAFLSGRKNNNDD